MGQHSETVSVGRRGTSVISFQCCGPQCPAPFTIESTALVPSPGPPLFFPVHTPPCRETSSPIAPSCVPILYMEQLLKRGWLDSVSQRALELGVGALSPAQTLSWSDRCHCSVTTS